LNPPAGIICLDLDGVSLETDGLHVWFSDAVAAALNEAVRRGMVWCSNSGRRPDYQFGVIQACRALESLPFAILSGERYIHDIHSSRSALLPRRPYNDRSQSIAVNFAPLAKLALEPYLADIHARYPGAEFYPSDEFVGWQIASADAAAALVAELRERLRPLPEAQVLRNGGWIIVTHATFGKGHVLAEAASAIGVLREHILAVGDQPNDLGMLDGRAARYVGCPSNADDEVKATVEAAGGWIADAPGCAGTVQLIERFLGQCAR
jgi:hydroxymethylpyrimidine pyrophosphatase-like HAD family hydrolase